MFGSESVSKGVINEFMTDKFVKQPMAFPGSANNLYFDFVILKPRN